MTNKIRNFLLMAWSGQLKRFVFYEYPELGNSIEINSNISEGTHFAMAKIRRIGHDRQAPF